MQARGTPRPAARGAVAGAAKRAEAAEEPAAAFAAIRHTRPTAPKLLEGRRFGCATGFRAERAGELAKERSVTGAAPVQAPCPRVGGLVAERIFLLGGRQMGRDHDRVRRSVDDLSAGQLSPREPDARRVEAESKGETVVQVLEPARGIGVGDGEEELHRNKISAAREEPCG